MTDKTVATSYDAALAALEKAQDELANFTRDKIAAVARQAELSKVREHLAVAGMREGGTQAAQRQLADATEEAGRIGRQIENLSYAIAGAQQQVVSAHAAAQRAAAQVNITAAMGMVGDLRAAGNCCSAAMATFLASYDEITALSDHIRRLGGRWPSAELFSNSVRRGLEHHLSRRRLSTGVPVTAPSARRELDAVLDHWVTELEISLDRQLEEPGIDEAAE